MNQPLFNPTLNYFNQQVQRVETNTSRIKSVSVKTANRMSGNTSNLRNQYTYLLLTELEVRNVSYGTSFFPFAYGPSAKRAGHKSTGKNEDT